LLLTSCFEPESFDCEPAVPAAPVSGSYVQLSLSLQNGSRQTPSRAATPKPGENGDGLMPGAFHENDINDLCIFVYNAAEGIQAPASTPVKGVYVGDLNIHFADTPALTDPLEYTTQVQIPDYLAKSGDHFVAVVNMGDLTSKVTNLGELRDYPVTTPWTGTGPNFREYTRFTMASADDAVPGLDGTGGQNPGTREAPIIVTVPVERTAARIDFVLPTSRQATRTADGVEYAVKATESAPGQPVATETVAKAYITHVRVVNAMGGEPYLLKRTAATIGTAATTSVTYLGKETVDADGQATNYVIEPTSHEKTAAAPDEATQARWFGNSRFGLYLHAHETPSEGQQPYFSDDYKVRTAAAAEGANAFNGGFSQCDFENEQHDYYLLGYVNENTMAPEHTNAWNTTGLVLRAKYVPTDVYTYTDTDGQQLIDDFADGDGTFWRYRPAGATMGEGRCLYFGTEESAKAYAEAHPADSATLTKYPGGVCYYNVWLRHANNGDEAEIGPMEFGIVRNNIYQVLVKSISGPGTPVPDETGPETIRSIIYVRPWNVRPQPEIIV